jgi:hypothetical protein
MNSKTTLVWGVCADSAGIIRHYEDRTEALPGGGVRAWRTESYEHEPASAYASTHPGPMPMLWSHGEQIGRIVALRRAHGNLYALGETTELEPVDLEALAGEHGLKWSTGTNNRRRDPLCITEISLTPEGATVGLPPIHWWKRDVVKGNPPDWVRAEVDRAEKFEHRSRGVLRVHEVGSTTVGSTTVSAADEYAQLGRDLGLLPVEHRIDPDGYGELEYSAHPGRIISVNGRPVR